MGILNGGLLHRAPLQDPQRILDIGTGAGNWAIDMGERPSTIESVELTSFIGDQYPSAQVTMFLHPAGLCRFLTQSRS